MFKLIEGGTDGKQRRNIKEIIYVWYQVLEGEEAGS